MTLVTENVYKLCHVVSFIHLYLYMTRLYCYNLFVCVTD